MKLPLRPAIDSIKTFSRTFVERPRFAMVISIVLSMAGGMAVFKLPVSQFPRITPPSIQVSYTYPGANAREVLNTVAMPIEDEVNGVDDMLYMTGQCGDDGTYSLNVTFEVESDRDMDMVKVQNRVAQAEAKLPSEVKQLGGRIRAQSEDMLGFITVTSPGGTFSRLRVSDYCYANIQPVLLRIPGVGDATIYGPKLSMRVWLDPARMAAQGMNSEEVIAAVSKQNIQASLGSVGAAPAGPNGAFTLSLLAKGRLLSPEEFGEIVVRRDGQGGIVRLKDVARTEIGEQNYMFTGQLNGGNAVSIALQQKPGANAIATMKAVRAAMAKLKESFPEDLDWTIPYDATEYVSSCIEEIVVTLGITFFLVVVVCYLFLQDWRATLIPCLTIPVSLASTFILMALLGYTVNILTLFGLVLAIGVVVDDCIVVVERVQFLIETRKLNAKEAAIQAMSDVTSAVIATTLVLLGIFVPVGFMSGITGRIYQQFSVTLSAAVCFSTVCALTLAPALCSLLLHEARPYKHGPLAWFNSALEAFKGLFVRLAKWLARRIFLALALLVLVILLTVQMFRSMQTSFLPDEDQRVVFASMEMPEGSSRDRTTDVALRAVEALLKLKEVKSVLSITGFSMIGGRGENQAQLIVDLIDWEERRGADQSAAAMVKRVQELLASVPEPAWKVFMPPAIPGVGMSNGITVNIQDKGTADPMRVDEVMGKVLAVLNDKSRFPGVMAAYSGYTAKTPHLRFNLDRVKAEMFKVPVATVYATLQNYLGSRYVNDVNLGTQVNRVTVQADWEGRATPEAVSRLYVRGENGAMVQIGSLGDIVRELGPRTVYTRDKYVTCSINVMTMPGVATGRVMEDMRKMFKEVLPQDFGYDWAALSFQEARNEGGAAPLIALAVLFGYLFLVAQYESWTIPLPVMLSIFVAVLGALCGLKWFGIWATGSPYPLSIYAQLGLVLLVGLASKNAILIVEFAKDKRENEGCSIVDAAGQAAGERLRALLMTALTTLLGTLPMMVATGAGAASRNHLGTTEFWGMFASVAFGILLVPGLYALFQTWRERVKRLFAYLSARAARRRSLKAAAKALAAAVAFALLAPQGPAYAAVANLSPADGAKVALVSPQLKEILAIDGKTARAAALEKYRHGKAKGPENGWRRPEPLVLSWSAGKEDGGPWKISIADNPDFAGASVWFFDNRDSMHYSRSVRPDGTKVYSCTVPRPNFDIGKTYWWKVRGNVRCKGRFSCGAPDASGKCRVCGRKMKFSTSAPTSFATEDLPPRWIELEGRVSNFRDLGGWRTEDGRRVKTGLLFRSQAFNDNSVNGEIPGRNRLMVEDVSFLVESLGLKTDLDLRSDRERSTLSASPAGPGVRLVMRSSDSYRGIFGKRGRKTMRENFRLLCDRRNLPLYFHCIAGADRTGALAYVALGVLGVGKEDLEREWELTFHPKSPGCAHDDTGRTTSHFDRGFAKYGSAGDSLKRRIELYLLDCGVKSEEIEAFRAIMLEPASGG